MKKFFGLLGVLVLFLLAAVAGVALLNPVLLAKRMVVGGVKSATGLELQVNGPMRARLIPSLDLHMENVVLANPAAVGGKPIVAARSVEVSSGWLSFLFGSHTLDRISLDEAVVDLETDSRGRNNWLPAEAATSREPGAARARRPFNVGLVEINGGTLAYRDLLGGKTARLDRTRATLRQVQADKLGEALINAGAAVYSDPKSGTNLEVNELNATASAIDASRISAITARGTTVKWRDATLPTGVEGAGLTATARDLGFDSSGPLSVTGGTVTWRDPASGGTLNASALDVAAKGLRGGRLDEVAFKSEAVAFAHPTNGTINAGGLTGTAKGARASGIEDLTFRSSSAGFAHPKGGKVTAGTVAGSAKTARTDSLDDVSFNSGTLAFDQPGGGSLTANNVAALIKTMTFAQLQGVSVESSAVGYSATAATRAAGAAAPVSLQQVSITTPVLAFGTPVDAAVAFMHNKERVAGTVKLPTPEALTAGGAIPANVSLKASRGTIDFDGRFEPGATTVMKGRTRAVTTSVDALAAWLVFKVPDTLKGPVTISGDIDAQGSRVALSNGQIEHGANKMAGTFAFDGSGARPKISGKITADRLDADAYIGMRPVPPKPTLQQLRPQGTPRPQTIEPEASLGDVFKEQVRAILNAPPTRSRTLEFPELTADQLIPPAKRAKPKAGSFTWSEETFDFTALRNFDLDIDWSVKQLGVRGMQFNVPQLKTVLDAGTLSLEGRELGTKDGKISGKAQIDAREAVTAISANFTGEAVDVYALSAALGINPMIEGDAAVTANVRSRGNSQRQLVEQLSGNVTTNMPEGQVIGYDLGSINIFTAAKLLFGGRLYDPVLRTPISGLKADLKIDKGVVNDSQVTVGGPILGVDASGSIGLVEQRIDYSGAARISNLIKVSFKYIGDWARATFVPTLGGGGRTRAGPGEASLKDLISAADIGEDAELALLIGRVLQKEGAGGVDPETAEVLRIVQKKALGGKP